MSIALFRIVFTKHFTLFIRFDEKIRFSLSPCYSKCGLPCINIGVGFRFKTHRCQPEMTWLSRAIFPMKEKPFDNNKYRAADKLQQ